MATANLDRMPLWMEEIVNPSQPQALANIPPPTGLTLDAIQNLVDGMYEGSRPPSERPRRVDFDGRSYYMTGDAFINPPTVTSMVSNFPSNAITYNVDSMRYMDNYRVQWDNDNRTSYWTSTIGDNGTYTVTTEPPILSPEDQLKNFLDAMDHEYHEDYEEDVDGQPVQEPTVSQGDPFRVHLDGLTGDIQLSRSAIYAGL